MPIERGGSEERIVGLAAESPDISHLTGLELVKALVAAIERGEDMGHYDFSRLPEEEEEPYDVSKNPLCADCLYPECRGCDR